MQKILLISLIIVFIMGSCKLKEDNTANPTENTSNSTISSITVTAPNGGEIIQEGSSYNITWTAKTSSLLRIAFSYDNGSTWLLIADSLTNTGTFSWFPVPNHISNQCLVRVSTVDGSASDVSDKVFSIIRNSNESLRIISPNGGESWEAGTEKEIKWFSSGIDSVKIEYTTNNGNTWNLIAIDKNNTGIYYWKTVPNTPSTLAKVRISDAKDGEPSTESSSTFNILPEPIIKVISPNGGEQWISGINRTIQWSSENIENVKISYTINNGYSWNVITASTPSVGFYEWKNIPNQNSKNCKIKIEDALDGEPFDVSDNTFTITSDVSIEVISPNGSEDWKSGTQHDIKWNSKGVEKVNIEFSTNAGLTWNSIISNLLNTGAYTWTIPVLSANTNVTQCLIRVSDASDNSIYDVSDFVFTISPQPSITVVSPNGGESFLSGTSKEILWNSTNVSNVKIELTTDGGAHWSTIVSSTPSIGFYTWNNIPNLNSLLCKIRISDANEGTPSDVSDNYFEITNRIQKSVQVIKPNGGEDWEAGTKQNITWSASGVSKVKIELTTDKGFTWTTLIDSVAGGAWEWDISQSLNSTQCQIRISDASDNSISDISDATFTISPIKFIRVTQPTGPATFKDSDPITITWESSGIKTVGIKYTTTNGLGHYPDIPQFYPLVDKIANQGFYTTSFSIPSDQYYVVVYNADEGSNGAPSARSIGNFTIIKTETPTITVTSPNGGEQWLANPSNVPVTDVNNYHPYEIRWIATGLEKVKIEWSTTGGGVWHVVPGADSTANDGIFTWAPGRLETSIGEPRPDSSDNCLIRVSNLSGSISDRSDGVFSIHESKMIRVEFPNNGEYFDTSNVSRYPMIIRWTSYAVSSVDIYGSIDNGVSWFQIVSNYKSTGVYAWDWFNDPNVGNSISSQGRIKIVDHNDSKIWDVNDIPFFLNLKEGQTN
ncbi:hypothetical protein ABRY23_00700 [Melioribacteraceae bacterium 4301-Me]|uniref:hypothetical protein n=1 Tax=Pyranulibacter aquaticus TaxID=3163344 RepID=UPI0035977E14